MYLINNCEYDNTKLAINCVFSKIWNSFRNVCFKINETNQKKKEQKSKHIYLYVGSLL